MEYAYLVASLPTLTFGGEAPITSAQLAAACEGPLLTEHLADVRAILSGHAEEAQHAAVQWYVARDTQLRSALARARAQRAGSDPQRYLRSFTGYDARTDEIVTQAMNTADPLERALLVDRHRWWLLDEMIGAEAFGAPAVFAYAFKLQLVEGLQALSESEGLAVADDIVRHNMAGLSS